MKRPKTAGAEEHDISNIRRLLRAWRVDSQTASSAVVCGMSCCGCGRTASFGQVARQGRGHVALESHRRTSRPDEYLVLHFPLAESCRFFTEALPFGLV